MSDSRQVALTQSAFKTLISSFEAAGLTVSHKRSSLLTSAGNVYVKKRIYVDYAGHIIFNNGPEVIAPAVNKVLRRQAFKVTFPDAERSVYTKTVQTKIGECKIILTYDTEAPAYDPAGASGVAVEFWFPAN